MRIMSDKVIHKEEVLEAIAQSEQKMEQQLKQTLYYSYAALAVAAISLLVSIFK